MLGKGKVNPPIARETQLFRKVWQKTRECLLISELLRPVRAY